MFVKLGFQNAWRNLQRSILAILSMALAASFFTFTVSLGRGFSQQAGQPLRNMLAGEIVVHAAKTTAEFSDTKQNWIFEFDTISPFSDLNYLFPSLSETGFLRLDTGKSEFSIEEEEALSSHPLLDGAAPLYRLPAELVQEIDLDKLETPLPEKLLVAQEEGGFKGPDVFTSIGIQGRDLKISNEYSLAKYLTSGRWFEPEDEKKYVAIISDNLYLDGLAEAPKVGETVRISLPGFSAGGSSLVMAQAQSYEFEFEIIGTLNVVSRTVDYIKGIDGWVTEPVYAYFNEFYIPLGVWQDIWAEISGGADFRAGEMLLRVSDLSYLQDIVYDLQKEYPQLSFIGMPEYQKMVQDNLSLEPVIPAGAKAMMQERGSPEEQTVVSADLRKPITLLVLLNAGLLVAANILILVAERKDEIAVLKALGAREREIIVMILAEAALMAGLGASLGFLFIRIQALLNQMTNHIGLVFLILYFVRDYFLVLGGSLAAALAFGLIPARKYARLSVMEVLRLD